MSAIPDGGDKLERYENTGLLSRNIRCLTKISPQLGRHLQAIKPSTRLLRDASGQPNVDLGDGSLMYPDGAEPSALRQVEHYLTAPNRLIVPPPQSVYGDLVAMNHLFDDMKQHQEPFARLDKFGPFGGFLVVFGLGLGYHLDILSKRLQFKTLIVVEPHDDFWLHSCHVFDWTALVDRLGREGRQIQLIRTTAVFQMVVKAIRDESTALLGGSYLFFHYQAQEFANFGARLLTKWQDLSMIGGWIEDQLTMLRNNWGNFSRPDFYLQHKRVSSRRTLPAIVVGAGPSLDNNIEDIRALKGKVVIISASSALRVLLENGIRPDIHCELENGAGLAQVAEGLAAKHGGLSDIILYAAAGIDPRIAPHFKKTAYFFRDKLSSTLLYGEGAEATNLAEPTSGNTAVHCALSLGFHDIYLFGLDFGARDPKAHHSQHSVYFNYEAEDELATYTPYEFDMSVPGNFGGEIMSGWLLNWGRDAVTVAIRSTPGIRAWNCSDGVRIEGTTALAAEAINFKPSASTPSEDVEAAIASFVYYPDGFPQATEKLAELQKDFHKFLDVVRGHLGRINPDAAEPQMEIVMAVEAIMRDLKAVRTSPIFPSFVGHFEGGLSVAHFHASTLHPSQAALGIAALVKDLESSLHMLSILIDESYALPA
jgi:hypothetical protein